MVVRAYEVVRPNVSDVVRFTLAKRERLVADHLNSPLTLIDIAQQLQVSPSTITSEASSIQSQTGRQQSGGSRNSRPRRRFPAVIHNGIELVGVEVALRSHVSYVLGAWGPLA